MPLHPDEGEPRISPSTQSGGGYCAAQKVEPPMSDHPPEQPASKDRMAYRPKGRAGTEKRQRTAILALRVMPEEKAEFILRAKRAGYATGAYLRALMNNGSPGPRAVRLPPADHVALRQILGALGSIGNNLNQIARALNRGQDLPHPALQQGLDDFAAMRKALLAALGKIEEDDDGLARPQPIATTGNEDRADDRQGPKPSRAK